MTSNENDIGIKTFGIWVDGGLDSAISYKGISLIAKAEIEARYRRTLIPNDVRENRLAALIIPT